MSEQIAAFWRWWAESKDAFDAGINGSGIDEALVEQMSERVAAIAPDLDWELAPGKRSEHALVVSPGGNPEIRAVAHRWWLAAPEPDATWEYHSSRQADPQAARQELDAGGRRVDLEQTVIAGEVDERRAEVDVAVHHPAFAELPENAAGQITFLVLDWLLGEEDVERWIGAIDVATERPEDARPAEELLELVDRVRALRPDDRGVIFERQEDDGSVTLAVVPGPLKPVDHPLLDTRVSVTVPFEARDDGLPERPALDELRRLEDELVAALGEGAFLAAHVTSRGTRRFELYVDGTADTADRARRWAAEHGAEAEVERDPGWDGVNPYR